MVRLWTTLGKISRKEVNTLTKQVIKIGSADEVPLPIGKGLLHP